MATIGHDTNTGYTGSTRFDTIFTGYLESYETLSEAECTLDLS